MPWLVVIWTIVTLCLEVCHISININCKVFRIPLLVLSQIREKKKYAHVTPILKQLHWLPVKYRWLFKTARLVYKFLNSGSPSYFEPFLSLNSCPYSTRRSHPDHQYLTVPPFHSSVFKSVKHFGHCFAFDAPKIWNELPHDMRSTSVASFRQKLKTYLFTKAYPP